MACPAVVPVIDVRDEELIASIDGSLAIAKQLAGEHLACRVGCTECCIGPFPISLLDARRLRRGLKELERSDPRRAESVRERARAAAGTLVIEFPGDETTGILWDDATAEEDFATRHETMPCPALDPLTGACDMYAWRPVTCRTFGPPVTFAGEDMPPCRLCYTGCADDELASFAVSMDPAGLEEQLVIEAEGAAGLTGQTVIALALLR